MFYSSGGQQPPLPDSRPSSGTRVTDLGGTSHWWDEMSSVVEEGDGPARFTADWYAAMRDEYDRRFPDADQRSRDNMRLMAEWAAR